LSYSKKMIIFFFLLVLGATLTFFGSLNEDINIISNLRKY